MQNPPASSGDTEGLAGERVLLVTKLAMPPVRSDLVTRHRLVNRLSLGIQRPLTLIAAPAGFGKTTLLSTWLEHAPLRSAWLSLEQDDDDLIRFWSYLFTALSQVHPGSETIPMALLQGPAPQQLPSIETVLTVWINGLTALPHEVVLVLDDYHLITAPPIHRSVSYLVDHLPPQLHLVLATRADPPLPLAHLRARGLLTEIRAADLRFTSEETTTFLTRILDLNLSGEDIVALEARTEGWIAGLQLAGLSMQGCKDISAFLKAFTGSQRYIIDYLTEEVLARQSEPVQTFLLQTSILERLQGSLCEAVIGKHGEEASGQVVLEQLEQANLFLVPLDEERRWYRYHQLFAEALRHLLQRSRPDLVPELHRRANAWYEQHEMFREAVHHALAAADFERAAHLIEHSAEMMAKRGEIATLRTWLEALPDELRRSRVELCLWQGWLLALSGQFDAVERLLQDLERRLRTSATSLPPTATPGSAQPPPGVSQRSLIEYAGRAAAIRAFMAFRRGDATRTIEFALQALEQLPEDKTARGLVLWNLGMAYLLSGDLANGFAALTEASAIGQAGSNNYAAFMATFELAQMQARQGGHLHQADQSYRQALELVAEQGGLPVAIGPSYVGRGELQYEWNHLDTASLYLQEGIDRCQQTGNAVIMLLGQVALARVRQAQEDAGGADTLIQKIEQRLRTFSLAPHNLMLLAAWHARLALAQGDLALASRWVQERKLGVDDELGPQREREYLTLARVLIAQHRPDEALLLLERLLHLAERQGAMGTVLEVLVLQAIAQVSRGDEEGAMEQLSRALSLAEPEGYIRLFVEEGAPIAHVLVQMRRHPPVDQPASARYREHLLAELRRAQDAGASHEAFAVPVPGTNSLAEPLSERELEVLRLIIAGYSNREIADQLVIALSTVKWYIKAIYGKLQVESRTKAIARARELNLFQ
jgi:LuxR family transcriptional regulator, maltose regulon positive regulatory protein